MKLKQRPEDFVVREAYRFDEDPRGLYRVYRMDKQKLSTFDAVRRISTRLGVPTAAISYCGLKDKQGRTEQLVAVRGRDFQLQEPDLRLTLIGRTNEPLSAKNLTANRFAVTVRDLSEEDVARVAGSVAEVKRVGVVNYFDSQRFGALKHGQGFIAKDLIKNQIEHALHNYFAKPSELDQTDDAKVKKFWAEHWGDWTARCPYKAVAKYRAILSHLREYPEDWAGAFLQIEPKQRAILLFEYQSYLWNEGVKLYLRRRLGDEGLVSLRYQAGRLLFPRELDRAQATDFRERTFPLLGPDSTFADPDVEAAATRILEKERITLRSLDLPKLPGVFFKHEERALMVHPGKLVVSEARRDEMNRGRLKVNVAFTLPPGAYATLVVKRLFWFAMLEEEGENQGELHPVAAAALTRAYGPPVEKPAPPPPPEPVGFREQQRRKKAARAEARARLSAGKAARAEPEAKPKGGAPKRAEAAAEAKPAGPAPRRPRADEQARTERRPARIEKAQVREAQVREKARWPRGDDWQARRKEAHRVRDEKRAAGLDEGAPSRRPAPRNEGPPRGGPPRGRPPAGRRPSGPPKGRRP